MFWKRRESREEDLERELRSHLELEVQAQEDQGVSEEEARYGARRALGNTTSIKEEVRNMWGWTFVGQLGHDLRYASRAIRANRAFSAAAILSLALGIGANTAIFTLIDALLLRNLPVPNPSDLLQPKLVVQGVARDVFAYPVIRALRERTEIFLEVAGFSSGQQSQCRVARWQRTRGWSMGNWRFLLDSRTGTICGQTPHTE
jgi:hypothetical protein